VERDDIEYRQELEEAIRKFSPRNLKHR